MLVQLIFESRKAECNNATVFPGIALGVILSRSRLLSDKMLVAAIKAVAQQSPALKDPNKGLVPDITEAREVSVHIAIAVIKQAVEEGLATSQLIPSNDTKLEKFVRDQMWEPSYRRFEQTGGLDSWEDRTWMQSKKREEMKRGGKEDDDWKVLSVYV